MGKVERVLTEVAKFLEATARRPVGVAAASLEPRASMAYTPEADNRMVTMMVEAKAFARSDYARVRRIFDELSPRVRAVLVVASATPAGGLFAEIGAELPEARALATAAGCDVEVARQRVRALNEYRLEEAYAQWRRHERSPIALAMRVLDLDRRLELEVTLAVATEADRAAATRLAIETRTIDVRAQTVAVVEAACDAYLAMRDMLGATRRAQKAENMRLLDDLLGKKRRKEVAKVDARLRRRAAELHRAS